MYLEAIAIGDRDKGDDLSLYHSNLGVLYHRYWEAIAIVKVFEILKSISHQLT